MTYGAIPITSKYEHSVIQTLAQSGYDIGPVKPLTLEISKNKNKFC